MSNRPEDAPASDDARPPQKRRPALPRASVLISASWATTAAILVMLAARYLFGIATPAETFGDRITTRIPLPLFSELLTIFGTNAKHFFYIGLLVGEGVLTTIAGLLYWLLRQRLYADRSTPDEQPPVTYWEVVPIVAWLWLLSSLLVAPLIGGGILGIDLDGGTLGALGSQVAPDLIFALVFVALLRREMAQAGRAQGDARTQAALSRRRLLRQGGVAIALVIGGAVVWNALASGLGSALGLGGPRRPQLKAIGSPTRIVPPPTPQYGPWEPASGQTPEITSADQFYYVSKNLVNDPKIDAAGWRLSISGLVDTPYSLSYADLTALPTIERYHTLECISNEVGGNLMSNALFTGVSLADVLNHASIRTGASEMIFRAADGYSDALHLSQALDERALIVYRINGQPLPQAHGFPARLLIPGLYGMKNGKWLTSLELGPGGYVGFWEQRGWTAEALVKMTARIDVPHDTDLLAEQPTTIAGVAYSADKGIAQVQVSTDGGQTWAQANLKRPLGPLTWVLWEFTWTPTAGSHILAARAVDLDGNVQSNAGADPLPDGASGYHAITVLVR
jgi:DMSO/TMAO reductase YedYZ molybdopterin-dependent catalytic subunit